jgi:HupE / UreJ protein
VAWAPARAHEIPNEIVLHAFVKPEGERLHFLVRVPFALLQDLDFPKRGPGYLDLAKAPEGFAAAAASTARNIVLYENGAALSHRLVAARVSDPSDKSFAAYDKARAAIAGPKLADSANVFWNQAYFDAHLEYPIGSARSDFSLELRLNMQRLKLFVGYLPPEGPARAFELHSGAGRVALDPRWHQAAGSFLASGFRHILGGADHLLFLLCLVLPYRRLGWSLVWVITSFTVAHSITLIAAARGVVPPGTWFAPFVETLIAASILYMALENIVRPNLRWRWLVTGLFGLVHGFGFAFLLQQQMQFAGEHLLLSLFAFNLGIELGQLIFIGVAIPLLFILKQRLHIDERLTAIVISAFVAHEAWHWMAARWEELAKQPWPQVDYTQVVLWILLAAAMAVLGRVAIVRRSDAEAGVKPH